MPDGSKDDRKKKTLGGYGWGFGCVAAAVGMYFLIDDSSPEAIANLPSIIGFVVLTIGKTGCCLMWGGIGVAVAGWEAVRRNVLAPRTSPAEEELPLADAIAEPGQLPSLPPPKSGPGLKGRGLVAGALRKGKTVQKQTTEYGTTS